MSGKIPQKSIENIKINYAISANFGSGDLNACIVLKNHYE
jgi:3-oxoacyl-(acyl-carrier-protein) synthase